MKKNSMGWQHCGSGRVTSVSSHEGGGGTSVTVKHGKRKRIKGHGEKGPGAFPSYDDRPESRIMLHPNEASRYSVGDNVDIATRPAARKQLPPQFTKKGTKAAKSKAKKKHAGKRGGGGSAVAAAMAAKY